MIGDPTQNIMLLGDSNFQDRHLSWVRSDDGLLAPLVHHHRLLVHEVTDPEFRQQAANLILFSK